MFGDFHGTPFYHNAIGCNPTSIVEASFGDKKCLVGFLSTSCLETSFGLPYILGSSPPAPDFHTTPQMPLKSSCVSPAFLFSSHLSCSPPDPPIPIPHSHHQSTHKISFSQGDICVPPRPNFSGSNRL